MGSWVAYGLGSMNQDLPAFVVLLSRGRTDQPLYDRLWGSGFLPTRYQGVKLRGGKEPVLYLANPAGCSPPTRRQMLDDLGELNQPAPRRDRRPGDPHARRPVRAGLPDAVVGARADRPLERAEVRSSTCTAPTCTSPAATPRNCLLARRLAERGVRFIQLYHMGWDQHGDLPEPDPQPVPATPTSPPPP